MMNRFPCLRILEVSQKNDRYERALQLMDYNERIKIRARIPEALEFYETLLQVSL